MVATGGTIWPKPKQEKGSASKREHGSVLLEAALVLPLLCMFLLSVYDLGFLLYAFIGVQNAARVAALDTSASSLVAANTTLACADSAAELAMMPNSSSFSSTCNNSPLQVTAQAVQGPDGGSASLVTVTYSTIRLIPLPWLAGQFTITRTAEMRNRS